MKWKRRDMGSDPMKPIFVTTELPVVDDKISVAIPVAAYKRLVDWCSMGRTMDNVLRCLESNGSEIAYEEMEALRKSLEQIHDTIRQHYTALPDKEIHKS